MTEPSDLPITPDFDTWTVAFEAVLARNLRGALSVHWEDGEESLHHPLFLAENDPAPDVLHPLSRETVLSPLDFPVDLEVTDAEILSNGAIRVSWSHGWRDSIFHPGWLRAHSNLEIAPEFEAQILWTGAEYPEPPTFNGPDALEQPHKFREWLIALHKFGVARLEGLPNQDGLLMQTVERIGPVRESNFGRMYTLEIKDEPDSNAFTSSALLQHIDMPTRECPHGLQFLFCRDNSTTGGEGVYVDAYRVAEDIRREEPDHFEALCEIEWSYNNRSKTSRYRATGPVVELNRQDQIIGIRYNTWLRAPLARSIEVQDRAYRSYRAFAARAQDPRYQMVFAYRPGDLLAFDNRRALHGRKGYDAEGGTRFIEGIYADRDDLYSAIRSLA